MPITKIDDAAMMRNPRRWPGETLCLKQKDKPGEHNIMGYRAFGIITNGAEPVTIYLRGDGPNDDWEKTQQYETFEKLLDDGWVVD